MIDCGIKRPCSELTGLLIADAKKTGLVPSTAGEERGAPDGLLASAFAAADAAAAGVPLCEALSGGVEAIASRLVAARGKQQGTEVAGPLRQLQALRAVWGWVLQNVKAPHHQCSAARGGSKAGCQPHSPALVTWEVGWPLFGDGGSGEASGETAAQLEAVS